MEEKEIKIVDNSRDKEYFTIVPNYILNHSTADEQALYMQMKRFAGESGECFATLETLSEKLGCKEHSVRTNIEKLLKRKWIEKTGTMPGKTHPINSYRIIDLWELNVKFYKEKKRASNDDYFKKDKRREPQTTITREPQTTIEEERIIKKNLPLEKPKTSKRKDITFPKETYDKVLVIYQKLKGIKLQGSEFHPIQQQIKSILMSGRKDDDIVKCMDWMSKDDFYKHFWTIKTVRSKLPEFLAGSLNKQDQIPISYKPFSKEYSL
ncbi:helix-turn-helix domain-containing protein [Patescibacteria group bacterium]|nr:helix-turn-helix domain-containing protein [Patescibacteria group bacterium]